ncbi:cysteine--tRNA ligase [Candidatus Micrarchaeota archaeon]|nr:cysteine--tRNA ligase [Candidatus Micrarchaeota archaeon]
MKVYNSLTKEKEEFHPIEDKKIFMYVCGLTPYDHTHLGHARTYVAFDFIKRYFFHKTYSVFHIQNITDVDDKIINRAKETNEDPAKLTERFNSDAMNLFSELNILPADIYPKVTEHIPQIIQMIQKIMENGNAYETETGIYFDVFSFKEYGKLSHQDLEKLKTAARIEKDETKKNELDFALWKKGEELITFDSPWGKGRPGWHIECSAIAMHYTKNRTLDIHGGARDLIFPHHENEIAQAESALKIPFVKYWMHTGFLTVDGVKMSKSLGNFITIRDALEKTTPNALRLFFLQSHYRSPIDFSMERIKAAENTIHGVFNTLERMEEEKENQKDEEFKKETTLLLDGFFNHLENDFDTPNAFSAFFELLTKINSHIEKDKVDIEHLSFLKQELSGILFNILGFKREEKNIESLKKDLFNLLMQVEKDKADENLSAEEVLNLLIKAREDARNSKNYELSDKIRAELKNIGIQLEDSSGAVRWRFSKN